MTIQTFKSITGLLRDLVFLLALTGCKTHKHALFLQVIFRKRFLYKVAKTHRMPEGRKKAVCIERQRDIDRLCV